MIGLFPRTFLSFSAVLHKTVTVRDSPLSVLDWRNSSDITKMDETERLNEETKATLSRELVCRFLCFSKSVKVSYSLKTNTVCLDS